jgi:ParB family transcriptional regulator, chromosome partitioning protein
LSALLGFDTVAPMKTPTKTPITVEHHCLHLLYAQLRLYKRNWIEQLVRSIEKHGQQVPVVIVPRAPNQWVLMDGYLRVNALRRLGADTIDAEIWQCEPAEALLMLLVSHQSRAWEAIEEALLLRELHTQYGYSQNQLAARMGRDQSWVCRRLSLLNELPESILSAITQGKLSLWSATRILAPMARAIPPHAELLLQYLIKNPLSTREMKNFYTHYQQSTKAQRINMVSEPDLFFKAQKLMANEKQAHRLRVGPEGKWQSQLNYVQKILITLLPLAPQVFTAQQEMHERHALLDALKKTQNQLQLVTETVGRLTDADERFTADHYQFAPKREQLPSHQPTA